MSTFFGKKRLGETKQRGERCFANHMIRENKRLRKR
jgi:hypothetical protein